MPCQVPDISPAAAMRRVHNFQVRERQTIARELQAKANIHIFTIHKISLVKTTQLLEYARTKQHESTVDPVRRGPILRLTGTAKRAVALK